MTDYDAIADEYRESKRAPWRTYVEKFTLMNLVGDIRGQTVIDLACGEGYFTRLIRERGVESVQGVDLSQGMIDLAIAEEQRRPLGIEYRVQDVSELDVRASYDLAVAAWLLNYASTSQQLARMCRSIARSLKPGGRFVTINTNPDDHISNFQMGRKYGFVKEAVLDAPHGDDLPEGTPVIWTLMLSGENQIRITNYHLSHETVTNTLLESGFREVKWHTPQLDPIAIQSDGEAYWKPLVESPPFAFLECFI